MLLGAVSDFIFKDKASLYSTGGPAAHCGVHAGFEILAVPL